MKSFPNWDWKVPIRFEKEVVYDPEPSCKSSTFSLVYFLRRKVYSVSRKACMRKPCSSITQVSGTIFYSCSQIFLWFLWSSMYNQRCPIYRRLQGVRKFVRYTKWRGGTSIKCHQFKTNLSAVNTTLYGYINKTSDPFKVIIQASEPLRKL